MLKSPLKDLQIEVEKLYGFFRGVVEDNKDPLKAGRVRIRIHGLHTPKKTKDDIEGIPTSELPWAEPCMPIHEGSVSGFGTWAVPLQGSQVMVFFENNNISQPRYFASMPGIPESKEQYSNNNKTTSKNDGFKDPDGKYPVSTRLNEPDVHRLARGVSNETLVTTKNNQRDIGIPTALGGSWSEPSSPFNAKYPHNHVIATHGGITIELDSTPGSTRINIYHPSNSFIEIDNDGNMVVKNNAEKYEIVAEGKNVHIKQQRNITIDSFSKRRIKDDETTEIGGDKIEKIAGEITQTIEGDKTENIGGSKTEDIGDSKTEDIGTDREVSVGGDNTETIDGDSIETIDGDKTETIGGSKTENITSDKTETIGGSKTENITSDKTETIGGNLNLTITGNVTLTASGTVTITGTVISLN